MSGEVRIRAARDEDAADVGAVWHAAWRDGHEGNVPDALVAHRGREQFTTRAAERIADTSVAEVDGRIVGFVAVDGDELEQIFVLAEARGTDVAPTLLRVGTERIAAAGHDTAWLAVAVGNDRACAFYRRMGWHDAGPLAYEAQTADGTFSVPCRRYEIAL